MVAKITQQQIQLTTHRGARAGAKGAQSHCHQLRAKIRLFWKQHSGLNRKILYRRRFEHKASWWLVFLSVSKAEKLKSKIWPRHTKRTYKGAALFLPFKYSAIPQCIPKTLILKVPKRIWLICSVVTGKLVGNLCAVLPWTLVAPAGCVWVQTL